MAKKKKAEQPKPDLANAPGANRAPEAVPAWDAYDRGDFAAARKLAKALLAGSAPDAAKNDARTLLTITGLDAGVRVTLAVMIATLTIIIIVIARHQH